MSPGDSVFSCIHPHEEVQRCAPPPPPPHPSPAPMREDKAAVKLTALEARIIKLEECAAAAASAAEASRKEAQAAVGRAAGLEKKLEKLTDRLAAAAQSAGPDGATAVAVTGLRHELSSYSQRMASAEEALRRFDPAGLNSIALSVRLLEGRLKSIETGFAEELHERSSALASQAGDAARKAGLALEMTGSAVRRLEKLEENSARLPYIERRFSALESRLERIYELDALAQSLKLGVEGMENKMASAMKESAAISGGQAQLSSDFESLSAQVRQMTALFNQFRTELSFLIPKKQKNSIGG